MSTTFGIKVPSIYDEDETEIVKVAFRSSFMVWKNPLAQLLPDNLKVIPLDNSAQGIYSIGDIKKEIEKSKSNG